jgi:hypothetical protein
MIEIALGETRARASACADRMAHHDPRDFSGRLALSVSIIVKSSNCAYSAIRWRSSGHDKARQGATLSQVGSMWMKSLVISVAAAIAVYVVFYFFFRIHGEVGVEPVTARTFAGLTFVISALASLIYFRMKTPR